MIKKIKTIAAGAMLSLMMLSGVVISTTTPASASGGFCGPGVTQPCAIVRTTFNPTPDCKVYVRAFNPGYTSILRTITFFHDGTEVFGDDAFIPHGYSPSLAQPPMVFGPLEDGEWRVLVTSGDIVMADKTFDFACGIEESNLSLN